MGAQEFALGRIEPGTEGWWRVWGASPFDIEPGDLIMIKPSGEEITEYAVRHVINEGTLADECGRRIITWANEDRRIGYLVPIEIVRRGTRNYLSKSAR